MPKKVIKTTIGIDFLLIIIGLISIPLIAYFADDEFRNVILTILSSLLGGTFSAVSFVGTILWNYFCRKEDHLSAIKPSFYLPYSLDDPIPENEGEKKLMFYEMSKIDKDESKNNCNNLLIGHIKNTNKVQFYIVRIHLDNHEYTPLPFLCVELGKEYAIFIRGFMVFPKYSYKIQIDIEDLDRNKYQCSGEIVQAKNGFEFNELNVNDKEGQAYE